MSTTHNYDWAKDDKAPNPLRFPDKKTYLNPFAKLLLKEILKTDGARYIAVNGGIGSGKSYAIAHVCRVIAQTRPGAQILLSGSSLNFLTSVLKKRCEEVFGHLATWKGGLVNPHYVFDNGSKVMFRAYISHGTQAESSNSLEGNDYTHLIVDEVEQLPTTIIDHALERTRLMSRDILGNVYDPQVILIGRPGIIDFWVKRAHELEEKGMCVKIMRPRTWDNPTLWVKDTKTGKVKSPYIENLRNNLSEMEFLCKTGHIPGSEMPIEGAIYSDFALLQYPQGNLIDWVYDDRECIAAIDFGRAHPAVLFIAEVLIDGKPKDIIFDELQPDDVLTPVLIDMIKAKNYKIKEIVCDPAGDNRNAQTGISDINMLRNYLGIDVVFTLSKDKTRIIAGISRVRGLICSANKERSLLVTNELWDRAKSAQIGKRTIRTLLLYSWKHSERSLSAVKGGPGEPDHIADALRYYVIKYRWYDTKRAEINISSDFDFFDNDNNTYRRIGK